MPFRRLQISLLILLFATVGSFAQSDTTAAVQKTEKQALYAGTGYGSNMIYLGSTISQNQPYVNVLIGTLGTLQTFGFRLYDFRVYDYCLLPYQ
jgi:hypothetical protein